MSCTYLFYICFKLIYIYKPQSTVYTRNNVFMLLLLRWYIYEQHKKRLYVTGYFYDAIKANHF